MSLIDKIAGKAGKGIAVAALAAGLHTAKADNIIYDNFDNGYLDSGRWNISAINGTSLLQYSIDANETGIPLDIFGSSDSSLVLMPNLSFTPGTFLEFTLNYNLGSQNNTYQSLTIDGGAENPLIGWFQGAPLALNLGTYTERIDFGQDSANVSIVGPTSYNTVINYGDLPSHTLGIGFYTGSGEQICMGVDNFITNVPEPSTLGMLGFGAGAMLATQRMRRKDSK